MHRAIVAGIIMLMGLQAQAATKTLKPNMPVCDSEELLIQMKQAIADQDERAGDYLLQHGCSGAAKAALPYTLLKTTPDAAKIRIYLPDGQAAEGWTLPWAVR